MALQLFLNLTVGTLMIVLTVAIHTFGLIWVTQIMRWVTSHFRIHGHRNRVLAMITVVMGIFSILTCEVWLWAFCYWSIGFLEDFPTALYFSVSTFSTLGYGDVLPHPEWRLLGGLEGIDGFLLIGWSTAYLVAAGVRVGPFRSGEHF